MELNKILIVNHQFQTKFQKIVEKFVLKKGVKISWNIPLNRNGSQITKKIIQKTKYITNIQIRSKDNLIANNQFYRYFVSDSLGLEESEFRTQMNFQ